MSKRTDAVVAHIDHVLANIHHAGATRSFWTTQQIEDLLLDIRNFAVELGDLDAAGEALGFKIKEAWG